MAEANFLPHDFPHQVLSDICSSLSGLDQGTAENSRPMLEYARNKIPEIRREFFHLEEEDIEVPDLNGEIPRLYRGMALDRHLNTLIGSVTTALDEYRVQAQQRFDDEVRGEETVTLRSPQETEGPDGSASGVIEASDRAYSELKDKEIDQTENGGILARRLKDGSNLAYAARSQIRSGRIVKRWFEEITKAILTLPKLIKQAGKAVKVGTDVADILADWWSETEHALVKTSIDQIRRFGSALENIGETLNRRDSSPSVAYDPISGSRDPEKLAAEAEVERLLVAGIEVPNKLAQIVQRLRIESPQGEVTRIERWQDIARCRSLVSLVAYGTDFELGRHIQYLSALGRLRELRMPTQNTFDISPLRGLTGLTTLGLHAPHAVDISTLGTLTGLTTLSLQTPEAVDISPLENLTNLTSLRLTANNTKDISALRKLTGLNTLRLTASGMRDISPLEALIGLTSLSLNAIGMADISTLRKLTGLTSLSLHSSSLTDISAVSALTNLGTLSLSATDARDISPLKDLTALTSLSLTARNVRDLSPMERLVGLTSLALHLTHTTNLSPLTQLKGLTRLSLTARNVIDISPLEELTGLTTLNLSAIRSHDISALGKLVGLNTLNLQANYAEDISPLEHLKGLTSLSLTSRVVSPTLIELFNFPRLKRLSLILWDWRWLQSVQPNSTVENLILAGGGIVDLAAVARLKNLKTLNIGDLQVINLDALHGTGITVL